MEHLEPQDKLGHLIVLDSTLQFILAPADLIMILLDRLRQLSVSR
jgi:hypothetical protein